MKSRIRVSLLFIAAIFFGASFFVVRSVLTQSTQNSPQAKISLRERAKRDGKAVTKQFPRLLRYDTLEALKKDSSVIVVGTVTARASRVSSRSENVVSTDYTIKVEESLKGDFAKDNTVRVNEVGGKLTFEDGTTAEMVLPDYWKTPQLEKTYVLFLGHRKKEGDYRLIGGPQGLFEVSSSLVIKPQGLTTDELYRAHDGMSLKKFAERVRANVEERAALGARGR